MHCSFASKRSPAAGLGVGPPKNRGGGSDGEPEREGEIGRAGETGLGMAAGAGAASFRLWLAVGYATEPWGCGLWERSRLASSRVVVFMAGDGFGTRFLFQLLPRRVVGV